VKRLLLAMATTLMLVTGLFGFMTQDAYASSEVGRPNVDQYCREMYGRVAWLPPRWLTGNANIDDWRCAKPSYSLSVSIPWAVSSTYNYDGIAVWQSAICRNQYGQSAYAVVDNFWDARYGVRCFR